jgi:hypothetical protein
MINLFGTSGIAVDAMPKSNRFLDFRLMLGA